MVNIAPQTGLKAKPDDICLLTYPKTPTGCVTPGLSFNLSGLQCVQEDSWADIFLRFSPVLQYQGRVATIWFYWERAISIDQCCIPVEVTILKTNKIPHLHYFKLQISSIKLSWLILFWISQPPWPSSNKHINIMTISLEQRFLKQCISLKPARKVLPRHGATAISGLSDSSHLFPTL